MATLRIGSASAWWGDRIEPARRNALKVRREVDAMAVSGVGMTGKRVPHYDRVREVIGIWSTLVPRETVKPTITMFES